MPDTAQFTQLIMVSAIVMLAVDTILAVVTLAGRLADGAAAGQLDGVARFKKRSITIKQVTTLYILKHSDHVTLIT